MSADRLAASNGGPGVSHTRLPEAGQQTPTPVAFPACVSTGAVCHGARDLPAARCFTRPSTRSVDRLSNSVRQGWVVIPRTSSRGRSAIAFPRSCSPSHSPVPSLGRFVTFRAHHHPLCRLIDGVLEMAGNSVKDPLRIAVPASDPTPIMPAKGTYSGKIESLIETRELRLST